MPALCPLLHCLQHHNPLPASASSLPLALLLLPLPSPTHSSGLQLRFPVIIAYCIEHRDYFGQLMPFNTHSGVRGYPGINQADYAPGWAETTGTESWRFQREWGKSEGGAHTAHPGVGVCHVCCSLKGKGRRRTELRGCTDISLSATDGKKSIQTEGESPGWKVQFGSDKTVSKIHSSSLNSTSNPHVHLFS